MSPDERYVILPQLVITFEPQAAHIARLAEMADSITALMPGAKWIVGPGSYTFRIVEQQFFANIQAGQMLFQSLGRRQWQDNLKTISAVALAVLSAYKLTKIRKMSLTANIYADLGMSQPELVDQIFGTLAPPRTKLSLLTEDLYDVQPTYFGNRAGLKFRFSAFPQTVEEVKTSFFQNPNLDLFIENRLVDTHVREVWEKVRDRSLLLLIVEIFNENSDAGRITAFLRDSMKLVDELTASGVNLIEELPNGRSHKHT